MIDSPYLVTPGKKFDLSEWPTNDKGSFKEKAEGEKATVALQAEIGELQEVLYAQAKHKLLVILQAMDTGGKDGTIKSVFEGVDPQGCTVTAFKPPTPDALARDFLWRIHAAVPPAGMIGIFNRSHYESVLVERVKHLVPKEVWSKRFDHINDFERMLVDEGTTILKFFLHISKDEQKLRLESRQKDPEKGWKFNLGDLEERKHWDHYMTAYQDVLRKCSTEHAPWYLVPADRKWFRNWVVSDIIVRTLRDLDLQHPPPPEGLEKIVIE